MTVRDSQRSRVYAAEEFVRTLFDRAAQHSSRTIDFFGTCLTLPPEAKFASLPAVQRYVDDVLAMPTVLTRWPAAGPVIVRQRRSSSAAHYHHYEGTGIIAVPDHSTHRWALRELVVLHEIAHHLADSSADNNPGHGTGFITTFSELAELVMGPEVGYVLRVVYAKEGVR